jgi:hypothetical protein
MLRHLVFLKQISNIFGTDKFIFDCNQRIRGSMLAIHVQAGPALADQVGRVAFHGVSAAELDNNFIGGPDIRKYRFDNSVLAILRKDLSLAINKIQ